MSTRDLVDLRQIVVHHSASPRHTTLEDIRRWHVEERGWDDIGYHFVVEGDGAVRPGRPVTVVGAHVRGQNVESLGVCLVGDNTQRGQGWTMGQLTALRRVVQALDIVLGRELPVLRHCDLAATACPGLPHDRWFDLLRTLRDSQGPQAPMMEG